MGWFNGWTLSCLRFSVVMAMALLTSCMYYVSVEGTDNTVNLPVDADINTDIDRKKEEEKAQH